MASLAAIVFLIFSAEYVTSELCGTSIHECAQKATCDTVTSKCRCDPPYWGNGLLRCYESNQVAAQIYTDVKITTFKNESVDFPYPCRYEVTDVRTAIPGQPSSKFCRFTITAFNKRFRGKTVLHGFDVDSTLNYTGGYDSRYVRIFGTANNGVNNITIMTTVKRKNGPTGTLDADIDPNYIDPMYNVSIKVYKDTNNGMVVYKCDACGVEIMFKPYDVVLRLNQPRVPGLFVSINTAHQPTWGDYWDVALNPEKYVDHFLKKGIVDDVNDISDLERSQSFVQLAMERSYSTALSQNQPDGQPGCLYLLEDVASKCRNSRRIYEAYNDCFWMLKEARFIRCLSDNGIDHTDVFRRCTTSHCDNNDKSCRNLIDEIPLVCHLSGIRELTQFIKGELCVDAWKEE